jgi:iron complex transport system substrate-binding protein
MYRKFLLLAFTLLLSFSLIACQQTQEKVTTSIPNSTLNSTPDTTVISQKQASVNKVVTLTSLSTDIIYQLNKDKLVGITGSKLFTQDPRFQNLPRVSEGQMPPNLEKILALKPDLVVGAEGFSNQIIDKLKQLGIKTYLTKVDSWESLEGLTKTLADFLGADPQLLLNRYQTFLPDKVNPNPNPNTNLNPSTLVLVSRQPILTPNKNSWAGNLLSKFQVKNLAAEFQGKSPVGGYVTLSAEKVIEANPEIVILIQTPGDTQILESFKKESFWSKLNASKNNRVYVFDYHGLVNPGNIDSIEKASKQLKDIVKK